MEVRPGYKMTEVGVIPEDWSVISVGALASFTSGTGINVGSLAGKSSETPVPVFGGNGVAGYTSRPLVREPTVVVGRVGQKCGEVCFSSGPAWITDNALFPRTRHREFDVRFLVFALAGAGLNDVKNRNDLPLVTQAILHSVRIAWPPDVEEQRAIATTLSDVDALLGGLERLIAKKRDLKQAAMQQLLTGQTRLPGFRGKWVVKTLFDLAERKKELFDDGDWIESEHIASEGVRFIQTGNIGVGSFIEKEIKKFIYETSFTSLQCKQLKTGDLLLCRLADPPGRACVLPDIGEDRIVTSVDVTICRPPLDMADRVFLANVFSTPEWFRAVSDRSGGTTHKRISRGALGRIAVKLPPLSEQTAIATVLSDMDAELSTLEARRDKTRALKQGMMQELLTGRIRLL